MADTLNSELDTQSERTPTASKNAVVYVSGVPKWDVFADEVSYPVYVERGGVDYVIYAFLRQHTDPVSKTGFAYASKKALRQSVADTRIDGDFFEMGDVNDKPFRDFVDEHFVKLEGLSTDDVTLQKGLLDKHPYLKTKIFREGIQGIALRESEEILSSDVLDIEFLDMAERNVTLHQKLYSPDKETLEEIKLVHTSRDIGEKELQTWRKASVRKFNTRKKKLISTENYDVMESLYKSMIKSVSGYAINGKPCTAENKDEWIDLIPLEHKLLVLATLFRETQVKNVS